MIWVYFTIVGDLFKGNEMFQSFLDPTMTYSCPIWKSESESLGMNYITTPIIRRGCAV